VAGSCTNANKYASVNGKGIYCLDKQLSVSPKLCYVILCCYFVSLPVLYYMHVYKADERNQGCFRGCLTRLYSIEPCSKASIYSGLVHTETSGLCHNLQTTHSVHKIGVSLSIEKPLVHFFFCFVLDIPKCFDIK
jgi:hypothetical protein